MALLKGYEGNKATLDENATTHDGYVYFVHETGKTKGKLYTDVGNTRMEIAAGAIVDDSGTERNTARYTATLAAANWSNAEPAVYTYTNANLKCGNGTVSPIISCISNQKEYNNIISAVATAGTGIIFTASPAPETAIEIAIVDFGY